jgi:hypothetical protein
MLNLDTYGMVRITAGFFFTYHMSVSVPACMIRVSVIFCQVSHALLMVVEDPRLINQYFFSLCYG